MKRILAIALLFWAGTWMLALDGFALGGNALLAITAAHTITAARTKTAASCETAALARDGDEYLESEPDSVALTEMLGDITIFGVTLRTEVPIKVGEGTLYSLDKKSLATFPALMGEANPMVALKSLPWIQTAAEDKAGLHVMGCDNYSNEMTICGAPAYLTPRIGDFLPLTNMQHMSVVTFSPHSERNFVGGAVLFDTPDTVSHRLGLEGNIGILDANVSLALPFGKKAMVTLSGRQSYLDKTMPWILATDVGDMSMRFGDYNVSALWQVNERNTLDVNMMYDWNKLWVNYGDYNIQVGCDWDDMISSIRWRHNGERVKSSYTLYGSRHAMDGVVPTPTLDLTLDFYNNDIGLRTAHTLKGGMNVRADVAYYEIQPQRLRINLDYKSNMPIQKRQEAMHSLMAIDKTVGIGNVTVTPSLGISGYMEQGTGHWYVLPEPEVEIKTRGDVDDDDDVDVNLDGGGAAVSGGKTPDTVAADGGSWTVRMGMKHQYLAQIGAMSSIVPMQFMLGAGEYAEPQRSLFTTLTYQRTLCDGMYALSSGVYYKYLTNALEYNGFLFDMITTSYDLRDRLIVANGHNFGANVMLSKQQGRLTGWISYALGRALRKATGATPVCVPIPEGKYFPASHERLHELNMTANYKIGRFTLGGAMVLASGIPYAPAKALYVVSEQVMVEYGEFNSARLKPYFRTDLMARYDFQSQGRVKQAVSMSIYNATMMSNEITHFLKIAEDGHFAYKPAHLLTVLIPSVNYCITI